MVHRTFLKPHKKTPLADRILTDKSVVNALTRNRAVKDREFPEKEKASCKGWGLTE